MIAPNDELRDPTPEELEQIRILDADAGIDSGEDEVIIPDSEFRVPLNDDGAYFQIDPKLVEKEAEQEMQNLAHIGTTPQEPTMDEMLGLDQETEEEAFETFKYFKKQGAFSSNASAVEMLYDGVEMIGDSMGEMAITFPERFAANFAFTEAGKKRKAESVATTLQMYGDIKLNWEGLVNGADRLIESFGADETSDEDLRSSYEFWKRFNEIENERLTIAADLAKDSWLVYGGDPEIRKMIADGVVEPNREASMGASMVGDPTNFIPFSAAFKTSGQIANRVFRGSQIALVKDTKKMLVQQAIMRHSLKKGALEGSQEGMHQTIKGLDGSILRNLDKIKSMSVHQRQALLDFTRKLPRGTKFRTRIERAIKGVPVKGVSSLFGKATGVGMIAAGKTVENAGNIIKFLQDLVPETAITMAVKLGIPEEKAVQLFDRGLVRQISGYGVAGVGSYAITDFLTDDEMLAMVATGTALGLPLFARAGRNTAILGREIMEPMTELPLFKRLQANGKETITDRIIDRSGFGATWKSLAEKSYRAGEGKIKNRAMGVRGSLSSSAQTTVNFLEKTKLARGVESAGRLANQTGKGSAIGASFGYVAGGGGEQEEAMYAGMGGGAAFGAGGYTMSKPFRMMKGASPLEINQRRYGSHQYFVKNLLPEGMKESFGNMSKEVQIAYANAAMSYKNTVFNFKALGRNEKGGRQYTHDGVSYIEVNTDSGWAIEPLLRHEISHYLEETGGTRAFNDLLLGNPLLGRKGMFTRVDSEGNPVLKKDGKSYESTKELDNWKYEYGKYFFEEGKPRDQVIAAIPDEVIAREIVAEHGADFFASDSRRYRDLHEGVTGSIMRALVSSPMLKNRTLLRSMLARLGGTFREDGILMSPNAVFGKMQRLPAVTELIRKYNRQIEGLSDEQVQTKFPKEDGDNVIDITGAEFAKNPELIEHLRAGTFMKVDENGNIVPDTAMTPAQQRKYNKSLSEAIQSAIKKRDAAAGLAAGHIRERINEDTGAISFEGRFIDNEIINDVAQMGGWNKEQIDLLRQLSFATKNYENEKGGSDWLVSYFKATGKGGGKYVNARVQHQVHVPYGFEISQKGNILIRTISVDALHKNIDKVFKKHGAEISRLFGTENAMDVFTDSMHQYHKNHAEGRSGWFGLDADNQLAREKANFINAMFGKSSKSHLEQNPWLDALDSGPKSGKTNPIYRSLRLERIGKADQLSGKRHVDPHKIVNNLMPKSRGSKEVLSDGEQITGKNMGAYMYTPEENLGRNPVRQPSEFQKQFDIQKFSKGGKFFDLKTGEEMTNKTYDGMTIDTVEGNRPNAITSDAPATLPTGHSSKVGKDVKVNMVNGRQGQTKFKWWKGDPKDKKIDNSKDWDFDRQAGESWLVSIESTGLEGNGRKVPVGGKDTDHVFARKLTNEVPTKLATYPKSKSNPRGRPTAKGEVVTGNVIGTMRMGKFNHFVYDEVRVVPFGQKNMPKRSPDHGLLGNVENGELLYSKTGDLHMMNHSEPISAAPRGNPWRYNAAEEAVYWWEGMPTKLDKDTVTAHLERKGYNVKRNKALDANSENFARDYESAHAFPLKQMPAKEKPFKPRLQKDSVLLRDGTIIEASGLRPTYDKYGRSQMERAGDSHSQALFKWVRENPKNKLAKKIGWKTQEEFFDYEGTLFDKMNEGMKQGLLVRITNDPDGSIIVNGKDSAFTPEVKRILDEEGIFREKDILFEDADSNKITDYYKVPEMEKPKKGFFSIFGRNMPPKIEAEPQVFTKKVKMLSDALKEKNIQKRITKGWEAVASSHKSFKVPFTFSKDISKITQQASGGKIKVIPYKDADNTGFHLVSKSMAEDVKKALNDPNADDYHNSPESIFAYHSPLDVDPNGRSILHVDSSQAPEQGKGFGFTAYQILLDYAAANDLVYKPSALSYINQLRSLSAMLSSALKHKSTKHLKPNVDNGFLKGDIEAFGKNYENDLAMLAISEMNMVRDRFKEIDDFDYNFKTGKFFEIYSDKGRNKPITNKRLQERLMADDRIDGTNPAEDGVGLATAKRAIITNKLFLAQVKDQGLVTDKSFSTGNLNNILYMPPTSKAFKGWFGESKVVDEKGKPLVVYHGTDTQFNIFNDGRSLGPHFGNIDQANDIVSGKKNANIKPVYLSIENPLRLVDAGNDNANSFIQQLSGILSRAEIDRLYKLAPDSEAIEIKYGSGSKFDDVYRETNRKALLEVKKSLISKGYDGIVYKNEHEGKQSKLNPDSYIAFSPKQIKSATGNKGTFDSSNPDIRYMPPKKTFDAVDPDVIRDLEGKKDQVQNKLTMADYGENPYIDSVALPSRMGVINQKVSGMFKSYDDVVQLIEKLADKVEYYMDKYPDFAARTASFYSDMGRTAFDMAKYVPMTGRDRFDIADLQLRFLALGSPRSAVAANMTKSARSIMGHMTGISGHKINPVDQQIAAQVTALDWKSGKHFEVLDPDRKGASDKVRNFYLNGLAELIEIAKTEGTQKDVDRLLKRAAITLDVIKPSQNLNAVTSVKLQKLLDGLATVDMWDMAAKEYAHPAYVIKKGRPTANAKPFLWSIPKHRVIGKMVLSGNSSWKKALKETGIDSAAELNFQQANSFQIDGKNNWNETSWNKRSKEGFDENTEWSYYTLADEGGLTPQGGGPLYDAHQTVDGLIADTLNRRGHASFFGKDKLLARNAQEILWALTKFENPLESNQKLVLFGDRFKHFQEAMVGIRSKGIGVSNHRVLGRKGASKEAQGIIGAILDTYNKTSDQKFPFEVDTFGTSKNAKSVQGKINELGKGNRDDGVMELTSVVADGLGDSVQRIADQYGQELVVQDVTQGFGGYTENGVPAVTPNISMTMRGDPAVVKQVMMEVSSALDQADGNVFRQPTILELNDPRMQFNEAVSFDVSTLDKTAQANFFNDLSQLVDGDGDAFLTGFTGTSDGMFIADQYYKSNRLHSEVNNNLPAIQKIMAKHKISDMNAHKLVAETFSRDDKVGKRSSFQRSINNLVRNKVRNAQGRKSKDLPRVGSPLQRVIDQMHSANNRELSSKEITDISARLASDLDLLLIEGKISEDSNAGHKEMIKEVLGKKKGKKFDTPRKLEKRQLEKLDSPKTTLKDKKATLWNMRPNQESGSGYFKPKQFENKAKKISGGKGIDLLGKETRKTFKSKNTYFTSPTQSGRVSK
jgi:hypothetical protein